MYIRLSDMARVPLCARVPPNLKQRLAHLKIDIDVDMEDMIEAAVRALLALVEAGRVPDDLAAVLARYDAEALEQLRRIVGRAKAVRAAVNA